MDWTDGMNARMERERNGKQLPARGAPMTIGATVFLCVCLYFGYKEITHGRYDDDVTTQRTEPSIPSAASADSTSIAQGSVPIEPATALAPDPTRARMATFLKDSAAPADIAQSILERTRTLARGESSMMITPDNGAQALIMAVPGDSVSASTLFCFSLDGRLVVKRSDVIYSPVGLLPTYSDFIYAAPDGALINATQAYAKLGGRCAQVWMDEAAHSHLLPLAQARAIETSK
jgi:hypothetical protein